MSRFLIRQVVGHFNKNGLERWFTIVCYKLQYWEYWVELHAYMYVYINSFDIKGLAQILSLKS